MSIGRHLTPSSGREEETAARLAAYRKAAAAAAALGLGAGLAGAFIAPDAAAKAYYTGLLVWVMPAIGGIAWLLVFHVMGGNWALQLGGAWEAGCRVLPLFAALFVPVIFLADALFPWAGETFAHGKGLWLSEVFFFLRAALYFAVWIALAFLFTDPGARVKHGPRKPGWAGLGLIAYTLTASLAGFDWMMALEPNFTSSIYGLIVIADQMLMSLAAAIAVIILIDLNPHRYDAWERKLGGLGALLLGVLMVWAYAVFMQYLVIWSGDLPHKTSFYLRRTDGIWSGLIWAIAVLYGVLPFVLLLFRPMRMRPAGLLAVAVLVAGMGVVERVWRVVPAWNAEPALAWLVPAFILGIGGLAALAFLRGLARYRALPEEAKEALKEERWRRGTAEETGHG